MNIGGPGFSAHYMRPPRPAFRYGKPVGLHLAGDRVCFGNHEQRGQTGPVAVPQLVVPAQDSGKLLSVQLPTVQIPSLRSLVNQDILRFFPLLSMEEVADYASHRHFEEQLLETMVQFAETVPADHLPLIRDLSHELRGQYGMFSGRLEMLVNGLSVEDSTTGEPMTLRQLKHLHRETMNGLEETCGRYQQFLEMGLHHHGTSPVALFKMALEALGPMTAQKGITLAVKNPEELERFKGWRVDLPDYRLYGIFWNLIQNAVKYSPSGSTVRVSLDEMAQPPEDTVSTDGQRVFLRCQVEDEGIGIPQSEQRSVLQGERGANAKAAGIPGTGHGLMQTGSYIGRVGGKLVLESPLRDGPNPGTRFVVTLPVARDKI